MSENTEKNSEQLKYEGLTDYFKSLVNKTMIFLGVISTISGILLYQDRNQMQQQYKESLQNIEKQIQAVKDISVSSITQTKEFANTTIDGVKIQTQSVALEKTQKELDYMFSSDKMQGYIRDRAVNVAKNQISEIVSETVEPKFKKTEEELNLLASVADAAIRMRVGHYEGYLTLKNILETTNSVVAQKSANKYMIDIERDYRKYTKIEIDRSLADTTDFYNKFQFANNIEGYGYLLNRIEEPISLNEVARAIYMINKLTKNNFDLFDLEGVKAWHKKISKR